MAGSEIWPGTSNLSLIPTHSVIAEARRRFDRYTDSQNPDASAIHPNLRGVVFSTVLRNAPDVATARSVFSKIINVYKNADTADQRLAALASLGSVRQKELMEDLLAQVLDTEVVRPQDLMYPLNSLCNDGADPATIRPRWVWFDSGTI